MDQKTTKTFMRALLLAMLAAIISAGLLSAEDYSGKFTLPVETKWGTATLPPGDYTFKLNMDVHPYTVKISGKNVAASVFAVSLSEGFPAGQSALIIVRRGGKGTVRTLHLAKEGLVFTYAMPRGEPQMLAQGPQLIQRVPVMSSGE